MKREREGGRVIRTGEAGWRERQDGEGRATRETRQNANKEIVQPEIGMRGGDQRPAKGTRERA